jgi:hypothetical protein
MPPNFFGGRVMFSPAIQQIKIAPIAAQPPPQGVPGAPVKAVAFQPALLSHVFLNVGKNGPVFTGDTAVFYDDRFDSNKKWYFPHFSLQTPLQNSFLLTCWISGVDKDANSIYSGEVTFTLQKSIPSEVAAEIQKSTGASFVEIPLNNLAFNFTVTLADKTSLSFPCSLVQDQNTLTLTVKLDQQDGLIRFYKFISNPVNANYCFINISGSYFGYTQKSPPSNLPIYRQALLRPNVQTFAPADRGPVAAGIGQSRFIWAGRVSTSDDTTDYITNDAMPFAKNIANVNFDCHAFPNNYLTKAPDNSTSIFACKPPFGDSSLAKHEYNKFDIKFDISKGSLTETGANAVYINVYTGKYLVIPNQYQIALDETDGNTLVPAAYLFTKIDADNISNSVATFKFKIAPAISRFQLLLLKKLLLQNIPASLNKVLDDIFVEFPTTLYQPELIKFDNQIPTVEIDMVGPYPHGVEGCNFLSLEFQNVDIGHASTANIVNMLKQPQGRLTETISFAVDSDTEPNPQAAIVLSLDDITGKGLQISQATDSNLVYLINNTLFTISASSLADKNDDPKALEPAVTIDPNQGVKTTAISDLTEIPFTEFQYSYVLGADYRAKILNEIRTDAGQVVKDDVIVTNNTGLYTLYGIDHIDFLLAIVNPAEPDPVKAVLYTTNEISLKTDGAVTFVDFLLPVASYLSKWSAVYSTVIHFTDQTVSPQQNGPQHIDDINSVGKLINLTASNLNLHKS